MPIIDIDANNVAFRLPGKSAESLLDLNRQLVVKEGLKVNVITDNHSERHSSKRASYQRAAKREVAQLDADQLHFQLNNALQSGEDVKQITDLLKKCETIMEQTLPLLLR